MCNFWSLGCVMKHISLIRLDHVESYGRIPLDCNVDFRFHVTPQFTLKPGCQRLKEPFFRPKMGRNVANVMKYTLFIMSDHVEPFLSHNFT